MNPILERNKSIYRLLLIASAVIGLLAVLLIALLWDVGKALRFYFVMLYIFLISLVLFVAHKGVIKKNWEQNIFRRPAFFRQARNPFVQPDDPDGWKYVKTGIQDSLFVVFFLVLAIWMVFYDRIPEYWTWLSMGIVIALELAVNIWHQRKLKSN